MLSLQGKEALHRRDLEKSKYVNLQYALKTNSLTDIRSEKRGPEKGGINICCCLHSFRGCYQLYASFFQIFFIEIMSKYTKHVSYVTHKKYNIQQRKRKTRVVKRISQRVLQSTDYVHVIIL